MTTTTQTTQPITLHTFNEFTALAEFDQQYFLQLDSNIIEHSEEVTSQAELVALCDKIGGDAATWMKQYGDLYRLIGGVNETIAKYK